MKQLYSEKDYGRYANEKGEMPVAFIASNHTTGGNSRELVNRIQNLRKEQGFDVTDNIIVEIEKCDLLCEAAKSFHDYIVGETLTKELKFSEHVDNPLQTIDVVDGKELAIKISKA